MTKFGIILAACAAVIASSLAMGQTTKATSGPASAPASRPAKAATPKDAVLIWAYSIIDGDEKAYFQVVKIDPKAKELYQAGLKLAHSHAAFSNALDKTYGKKKWYAPMDLDSAAFPPPEEVANGEVEEHGDKANVGAYDLVKEGDVWRVVLEAPPADQQKSMAAFGAEAAKAFDAAKAKIGQKGYDADKVLKELGESINKIMEKMQKEAKD